MVGSLVTMFSNSNLHRRLHRQGISAAAPSVVMDGSDVELSTMRQAIAQCYPYAVWTEAPHYYVTTGVDMTDAMSFRAQLNAELRRVGGARVSGQ